LTGKLVEKTAPMLQVPCNYAKMVRLWRGEGIDSFVSFVLKAGFASIWLIWIIPNETGQPAREWPQGPCGE
jgi:hypothetical protein